MYENKSSHVDEKLHSKQQIWNLASEMKITLETEASVIYANWFSLATNVLVGISLPSDAH
jgi:hypothetical protein